MSRYFLSADSYLCVAEGHAVFLDLKKDAYTALEPHNACALDSVVRGWPASGDSALIAGTSSVCNAHELANELLEEGLLTDDERHGKLATPVSIDPPIRVLHAVPISVPSVSWKELHNFISAWAVATAMLRSVPLRLVVRRAQRRKAKLKSAGSFDLAKAQRIAMAYFMLQPNFYSIKDQCLRHSLTFSEFLSRYGLYATWVFGVRMNPFAAHSWVQQGDMVLNDSVAHVRTFTPILAI